MLRLLAPAERTVVRQAFDAWSVEVPATFAETFVDKDSYWHAYDEHRSVSLTSIVLSDKQGPITADRIVEETPRIDGTPVEALPAGLLGSAVTAVARQPARASRVLSGMLAAHGRLLLVTITSDDLDWATQTWLSIRHRPAWFPNRRERRAARSRRRPR